MVFYVLNMVFSFRQRVNRHKWLHHMVCTINFSSRFMMLTIGNSSQNSMCSYECDQSASDAMDFVLSEEQMVSINVTSTGENVSQKKAEIEQTKRDLIIQLCVLNDPPMQKKECSSSMKIGYTTVCTICRKYTMEGISKTKKRGGNKPKL